MSPDPDTVRSLLGRSLLATTDWSTEQLDALLAVAAALRRLDRAGRCPRLLPGELAYAIFFDNSTRTRSAWAGAAARLGMSPVVTAGSTTQVAHGETAAETGAMLAMNAHALGVRHDLVLGQGRAFLREILRGASRWIQESGERRVVPVVNLQCDLDHPTQTLADLAWLRERLGGVRGRRIAVSWASSPSYAKPLSVPQGLVSLLPRFGARVVLAHPPGYELEEGAIEAAVRGAEQGGGTFEVVDDMDAAFRDADAVYPKSWGPIELMRERAGAGPERMAEIEREALERNAANRDWICDERRMELTAGALYLHCLPADIGVEVSPGVMRRFRAEVAREASWKVHVIMALLAAAKVPGLAERLEELR